MKKTLAFPATMKYNLFMHGTVSIDNCIKSFERDLDRCYQTMQTLKTFRGRVSNKVLGLFLLWQDETYLYGMQQKPARLLFKSLQPPILTETAKVKHRGNNASKVSDVKQLDWIANGNSRGLA